MKIFVPLMRELPSGARSARVRKRADIDPAGWWLHGGRRPFAGHKLSDRFFSVVTAVRVERIDGVSVHSGRAECDVRRAPDFWCSALIASGRPWRRTLRVRTPRSSRRPSSADTHRASREGGHPCRLGLMPCSSPDATERREHVGVNVRFFQHGGWMWRRNRRNGGFHGAEAAPWFRANSMSLIGGCRSWPWSRFRAGTSGLKSSPETAVLSNSPMGGIARKAMHLARKEAPAPGRRERSVAEGG